jgi:hypothetical protein
MTTLQPVSEPRRASFLGGVFLITFAVLVLQVVQTRILSVIAWYLRRSCVGTRRHDRYGTGNHCDDVPLGGVLPGAHSSGSCAPHVAASRNMRTRLCGGTLMQARASSRFPGEESARAVRAAPTR